MHMGCFGHWIFNEWSDDGGSGSTAKYSKLGKWIRMEVQSSDSGFMPCVLEKDRRC
jgi:hypothetical protein